MLRLVINLPRLPEDGPIGRQTGRSVGAEMDENVLAVGNGSGTRVRVLGMDLPCDGGDQRVKHGRVPGNLAGFGVHAQGVQRMRMSRRDGTRQKDLRAERDRRGPGLPRKGRFPADVFGRRPMRGESDGGRMALPARTAKLEPILGDRAHRPREGRRQGNGEHEEPDIETRARQGGHQNSTTFMRRGESVSYRRGRQCKSRAGYCCRSGRVGRTA